MKVLVNATPLLAPLTGIGQYVRQLFEAMQDQPDVDLHMHVGLRLSRGMHMPPPQAARTAQRLNSLAQRWLPAPRTLRRVAEQWAFRRHAQSTGANTLYHEPNYLPLPFDGPRVITVCDMSCFDQPQTHPAERVALIQRYLPDAVNKADHLIVISHASAAALQRWLGVKTERITVTHLAADQRFRPYPQDALVQPLATLGLSRGSYLLCVGTMEPRKNLATLFAAYAGLPPAFRERFPLVVAGMGSDHTPALLVSAQRLIERGELRLLGYVDDALLPLLYCGAAAFCYPSRYEGFGLPPLEAMACGTPVLTSNATALPEVVGDAGIMVDPDNVDGMREGLLRLVEDREEASRLARLGRQRAATFSWQRCAEETRAVYEQVMTRRGVPS